MIGTGLRHLLATKENFYSLSVGTGIFREKEKLDLRTYQETIWNTRLNSYYSYNRRINDNMQLSSTAYFQPSLTDKTDYRVLLTASIRAKLTESLELALNYKLTHDSQPAKNLDADPVIDNYRTNTQYATTLIYRF